MRQKRRNLHIFYFSGKAKSIWVFSTQLMCKSCQSELWLIIKGLVDWVTCYKQAYSETFRSIALMGKVYWKWFQELFGRGKWRIYTGFSTRLTCLKITQTGIAYHFWKNIVFALLSINHISIFLLDSVVLER